MKTIIESPYGKYELDTENMVTLFIGELENLKAMQKKNNSPHLVRDVEGYKMIVEKNSHHIAKSFLEIKGDARENGHRFQDNLAVIEHMKEVGVWK